MKRLILFFLLFSSQVQGQEKYYEIVDFRFYLSDSLDHRNAIEISTFEDLNKVNENPELSIDTLSQSIGIATFNKGKFSLSSTWGRKFDIVEQTENRITFEHNSLKKKAIIFNEPSDLLKAFSSNCFVILFELERTEYIIADSFSGDKIYTFSYPSFSVNIEPINDNSEGVLSFEQDSKVTQGYYELHTYLKHKKISKYIFESDINYAKQFYIDKKGFLYQFKNDSLKLKMSQAIEGESKIATKNKLIGEWKTVNFRHSLDSLFFDPILSFTIDQQFRIKEHSNDSSKTIYFRKYGAWELSGQLEISPSGKYLLVTSEIGITRVWNYSFDGETLTLGLFPSDHYLEVELKRP
ncbi:MAG: hypothetical protein ABJH98_10075 [Reichenbachiella sp.]|uniref:hypothetical protein n=1 Tax=Reichenbachiella sp. TaxID=2184521 RepID=UPI0032973DAE